MITGVDSGAGVVLGLLAVILSVAVYVWVALALSAAFRKMGEESWRAWVPLLNIAVLLRWAGFSMWLALLALVPGPGTIAVWILVILAVHRINPGFGYGAGMTVVGALLFPVWATIVGFGPADWRGARPAHLRIDPRPASPPYAPFGSIAPEFGAPLPPPPLPGPAPATGDLRSGSAPAPAASVAPQPWVPESAAFAAPGEARGTTPEPTGADERPDPTAPTPTLRSAAGWVAAGETPAGPQAPFPPHAAPHAPRDVSPPIAAAPGIVSSVPGREEAPVTRLRPPAVGAERDESDVFPELTGEVSAVPGSPAAGAPVSAAASVSAQERENREAEASSSWDEDLERTVVVRRGHARWELVLPDGTTTALSSDVVILGRNPLADPARPSAQLIAIADPTRTVSKTHARLERRGEAWRIIDLRSTNGILLPNALGADVEVDAGGEAEVADRFLLGDAALRLQRTEAGS
ncbi:DUF5684 domain-containing protein [Microbacterium sp. NPDC077663]|uniref:DUF5684 domain-containing protein n=1 Tax=Microbacterium sp. NPDC077663 TaxID=3364189 RepID=UPI0037CBCDBE